MKKIIYYNAKFIIIWVCIFIFVIATTAFFIINKNNQPSKSIDLDKAPKADKQEQNIVSEKTDYNKTYQSRVLLAENNAIENINGINCIGITITGLTDNEFQKKINEEIKAEINTLSEIMNKETNSLNNSTLTKKITAVMTYSASNILSIAINGEYIDTTNDQANTYRIGLNYNLLTKEKLKFSELFTDKESELKAVKQLIYTALIEKNSFKQTSTGSQLLDNPDYSLMEDELLSSFQQYLVGQNYSFVINAHGIDFILNPYSADQNVILSSYVKSDWNINIYTKYLNQGNVYTGGKNSVILPGISLTDYEKIEIGYRTDNFYYYLLKTGSDSKLDNVIANQFQSSIESIYPNNDLIVDGSLQTSDTSLAKLKKANASAQIYLFDRNQLKQGELTKYIEYLREHESDFVNKKVRVGLENTAVYQENLTYYFYDHNLVKSLDDIFNYNYKLDLQKLINASCYNNSESTKSLNELYDNDWIINITDAGVLVSSKKNTFTNKLIAYEEFNLNKLK